MPLPAAEWIRVARRAVATHPEHMRHDLEGAVLERLTRDAPIDSWPQAMQLARWAIADEYRRVLGRDNQRDAITSTYPIPGDDEQGAPTIAGPGPQVRLDDILACLPDTRLRTVARMSAFGFSLREIGERLGVSESRAGQLLEKCRRLSGHLVEA